MGRTIARVPAAGGPARALSLLAGFLAGGCALLPLGGRPVVSPGGGPSAMGLGLRDFRVAFHCHSHLSHDSDVPFDEIAATARHLGFNAILLNDHYEPGNIARSPHGLWDGILFIPGVEMRPDVSPKRTRTNTRTNTATRGALLITGIKGDFSPSGPRLQLAEKLAADGALVVAGHCEEIEEWDGYPFAAYEVYNLHAQFKQASTWGLVWRLLFLLPDPFFEAQVHPLLPVIQGYDRLLRDGRRLAPLAGHDAHANVRPFGSFGPTIGTYPEMLRLFSNHVLAERLERDSLIDGIRRGRVYISFDFLGDPSGFAVSYEPGAPGSEPSAILGDEAPFRESSVLRVRAPAPAAIRILRDGALWKEGPAPLLEERLPGPGVYRVEAHRQDSWGRFRLWIFASPIYIREGKR